MVMFDSSPSNVGLQDPARTGPPAESQAASPAPSTEPNREPEQQQALRACAAVEPSQPQPSQPSQAVPQPEPVPTLPIYEFSVPPVPEPPPAPTSRDFPKPPAAAPPGPRSAPSRCRRRPAPPAQQRPPPRRRRRCPRPCPAPTRRTRSPDKDGSATTTCRACFVISSAIASIRRWRASNSQGGRVVTRVTIERDGGLIDARIDTSSGWPAIDQRRARRHPQGRALPAGAERHAGRSGDPDPADELQLRQRR